jgi:hypothetical protein
MADEPVPMTPRTAPLRRDGRRILRAVRRERGQALLEFAIVVPLILLLVLGIVDFGIAYNYKNDQTSLANQALRYAEVNSCTVCGGQPLETYIKTTADSPELQNGATGSIGIEPPGVTISFCFPQPSSGPANTGQAGNSLEAKAESNYRWLPFLGLGLSAPIRATAIGRIEKAYDGSVYTAGPCP